MQSTKFTTLRAIAALCATFSFAAAQAHQVWLEQDAQGAKLYFGEYGDNLRETTPGLLDKFGKPTGQKLAAGKAAEPLQLTKTPNGFALSGRAARGETLIAEEATYPISERKQGDKTTRSIYQPAARLVTEITKQEPVLTLDLVPTGPAAAGKVEVQAFYKGKPLPKAKVAVVTASGWAQEHHTDEAGKMSVSLPWRGTYVLELSHTDATGGERAGEKWDRGSYVTSLTLEQADGLAALPANPPATPNK
jgi:uncharacterized GH25 family protein